MNMMTRIGGKTSSKSREGRVTGPAADPIHHLERMLLAGGATRPRPPPAPNN